MFSGCLSVSPCVRACVLLARYLTKQCTEFHQTFVATSVCIFWCVQYDMMCRAHFSADRGSFVDEKMEIQESLADAKVSARQQCVYI